MYHTAFFILTLSSFLGVSVSAPTRITKSSPTAAPTHVAPSTCTTYYPSVLRQLTESAPGAKQANTAKGTKSFQVAQSVSFADNIKFDRIHQYVVFDNIASGSWDCQLMVSWYVACRRKPLSSTTLGDLADHGRQAISCRPEHIHRLQIRRIRLRLRQPRRVQCFLQCVLLWLPFQLPGLRVWHSRQHNQHRDHAICDLAVHDERHEGSYRHERALCERPHPEDAYQGHGGR